MDFLEENRDEVFASLMKHHNTITTEAAEGEKEANTNAIVTDSVTEKRKRKRAPSGKPSSTTPFEEKMLEIEEEKLLYKRKTYELKEREFLWKKESEEKALALREREIALKEKELDLKLKEIEIKKTLI